MTESRSATRHETGEVLDGERTRVVTLLRDRLPAGAKVLELGCATGVPTTRELVKRFAVTGVEISARNIALARQRVPEARLLHADITQLDLPPASFDAVVAFYTITHVPREEHAPLLQGIARWPRPGGLFVASMGAGDDPGTVEDDWLGARCTSAPSTRPRTGDSCRRPGWSSSAPMRSPPTRTASP
jgi:SAM-dependent methyltransferase